MAEDRKALSLSPLIGEIQHHHFMDIKVAFTTQNFIF
jgi:hypothetical protein